MKTFCFYLLMLVLVAVAHARHIHSGRTNWINYADAYPTDTAQDTIPVDVIRRLKPAGFVPINHQVFFNNYLPCEDGFKRDLRGVCREVWD